ncbi:MAG: urea ABC transporter permease subunit UrtC [Burkholderiaceae bacterium]|nr:urea ABC transporter permease subunit UrtC [Burkholderiaceae bacterium]MBP7659464.1 urea ABC transporter permease subunit UrtC [Burkholderiaceae bacterium]
MTPWSRPVLSRPEWATALGVFALIGILVPLLHVMLPESHALRPSTYAVTLVGKILCFATVAVAMDLIWGFAGILSLGHGLFFALGGYAWGMYLMRQIGRDGSYGAELPDFMVFLDWKQLPWYWQGSDQWWWAMLMVLLVPGLLALVFGWFAFRSRIKGVYLSIVTQALTYAAMLLFFRNETGFGGNNGFTDFKRIFGVSITSPGTRAALLAASALCLLLAFLLCRYLVRSKFGRVLEAIRDAEARVMFLGYDPLPYKLSAWVISALLCAIAGALYVPQVGIINPGEMSPANSIEIAVWVAVGGRGTLIGPIVGAFLVNLSKSWFTQAFPQLWLFFLGLLFVIVTLALPRGVVGLVMSWRERRRGAGGQT